MKNPSLLLLLLEIINSTNNPLRNNRMSQEEINNTKIDELTDELNKVTLDELNELMQTKEQLLIEKQRLRKEINFYRQRIFCNESPTNSA